MPTQDIQGSAQLQGQLQDILEATRQVQSSVSEGRLFDVLAVIRDQINRLADQHNEIRNDISELTRIVLQQNSTSAD